MSIVLVVDDRRDARYSMAHPLEAAGFDVRETSTGRDALRLARALADAIVLDIVLHDMDGFDVLRKLKSDRVTKDVPVVLKTAVHNDEEHRERALQEGAAAYLNDPFDPQVLIGTVRAILADSPTPKDA